MRRFENDTFESVEIESVVVSAHPQSAWSHRLPTLTKVKGTHIKFICIVCKEMSVLSPYPYTYDDFYCLEHIYISYIVIYWNDDR